MIDFLPTILLIGGVLFLVVLEKEHRKNKNTSGPNERHLPAGRTNSSAPSAVLKTESYERSAVPNSETTTQPTVSSSPTDEPSAAERYERAMKLWDTKDAENRREAIQMFLELCKQDVDFAGPYRMTAMVMCHTDEVANSGAIVSLLQKAYAAAPDDLSIREELQIRLFTHGKVSWDREKHEDAFRSYMDGLDLFSTSGEQFSQSSPLLVRIAFVASRMFSKNAHESGNSDLAVRFLDWCEQAGVDMNEDIDVSDARA